MSNLLRSPRWLLVGGGVVLLLAIGLVWTPWKRGPLPLGVKPEDYERARQSYERRYHQTAKHHDIISWLAESAVDNQRLERAVLCFQAIPSSHSKYGHAARLQQGQILLRLKHATEAEDQLREFLHLEQLDRQRPVSEQAHALDLLRHILEVSFRFEERVSVLEEIEQIGACEPFSLVMLCFPTIRHGPAATQWLEEFWQAMPEDFELRVALARSRTSHGRMSEAKRLLDDCRKERPQSLTALAATLAWHHEQDDWEGFAAITRELPPIRGDDPWLLLRLRSRWALRQGRTDEAVAICQTLLKRNRTDIEGWQILAEAQSNLGLHAAEQESRHRADLLARIQNRLGGIVFHSADPDFQDQVVTLLLEVAELSRQAGFDRETRQLAKYLLNQRPNLHEAEKLLANATTDRDDAQVRRLTSRISRTVREQATISNLSSEGADNIPFQFAEIASESGIRFERFDDIGGLHRLLETNGGGVACLDYDADGLQDLYFSNGCRLPLKFQDRSHPPALYRNLGQARFELVTSPSGMTWFAYGSGCAVGDFDADGFDDLFVGAYGRTSLWRNNGDGTFRDVSAETGVQSLAWNSSAAFADVNRDGNLDLYVVTYLRWRDDPPDLCPQKAAPDGYTACPPTLFPAEEDVLFVATGDGKFVRASLEDSGLAAPDGKGLGVVIFHADTDEWPDIYVTNDGTPNFLFINRTDSLEATPQRTADELAASVAVPRFEESATPLGCAVNRRGEAEACMGIACGDYDADGWLDLLCTNFHGETNTLYRNLAGSGFSDETSKSRLGPPSHPMLGFGTQFFDADNNGWLDLIVANGHIDDWSWKIGSNPYRMPPQLFRNNGNHTFSDMSASAGEFFRGKYLGRGLAIGDLENDGDLDVIISHQLGPSAVLRNQSTTERRSVTLQLIGTGNSNRSAINAVVVAEGLDSKVVREVIGGGSFQSTSDLRVHLGLDRHARIPQLSIRWPSGKREEFRNVAAGHWRVVEGHGLFPAHTSPTR